jgi:serine protease Do
LNMHFPRIPMPTIKRAFLTLSLFAVVAVAQAAKLPDFTALVERSSPAVVNIEATRTAEAALRRGQNIPEEDIPELFRRFFGQPGMPVQPRDRTSTGSGFIISADGEVLTNHHVVDGADQVIVRLPDRREFEAKVVGSDPLSDVALLKIQARGLPTLPIGDSSKLKAGQWVVAIGSPFGYLDNTVTAGIVSATGRRSLDQSQQYVPFIQTDVAINRGNSGGPLLNTDGEVVGINSQIFSNTGGFMGVSFAIPIDVAMNAARQIRESGRVRRGQLGVQIQDVTRDFARSLGLERSAGALVADVVPGSPADKAGIRRQDVILEFNGQEILRSSDLPPLVGATAPGTRVKLRLLRDGKERTLDVVLGELSAPESTAGAGGPPASASGGLLGLVVEDLTAEQRQELGLKADEGVLVSQVTGLAARRAGLQPGDVILMVGRTAVGSAAAFAKATEGVKAGDAVMLLVRRDGQTSFIAVTPRGDG